MSISNNPLINPSRFLLIVEHFKESHTPNCILHKTCFFFPSLFDQNLYSLNNITQPQHQSNKMWVLFHSSIWPTKTNNPIPIFHSSMKSIFFKQYPENIIEKKKAKKLKHRPRTLVKAFRGDRNSNWERERGERERTNVLFYFFLL